jgi:hypothetical protein
MGYQRGERGRLASLITVIILGSAVVGIDHISGRSVRPLARTEPANQVISMDLSGGSQVDSADTAASNRCDETPDALSRCQRRSRPRGLATRTGCRETTPITNAIELKVREARVNNSPVLARLSEMNKQACFLELQLDSIPPLEKRLIALASHMASVRSVSIRMDGEVRINKGPAPAPAPVYLIRVNSERAAKIRERSLCSEPTLAIPAPTPSWKRAKATS